jgi:3-dehydroquinate synthase
MKTVPVSAERTYQVEIGVDWKIALNDWIEGRNKVAVIASEKLELKIDLPIIRIPDGESGKSSEVIVNIWQKLGELGLNRNDLIIGIGGGTVTDLAGYVELIGLQFQQR